MSWQAYVDSSLVGTGLIDKAAIFGQNMSKWASSPSYEVSTTELDEIIKAYADKSETKAVQSSGLHVAGERFVVIKADERSIYGKKGKEGIVVVKTKQAFLIGHHPETVQTPQAATVCENLGDYLEKSGY